MVDDVQAKAELHWLSAAAASRAFATRQLSPVQYMHHMLSRIERLDPKLNVFIRLDGDAAMDAARAAEQEIIAGRPRGPLHGVPVGIKDIIDVGGVPTTCHSKILIDNVAAADSAAVAKLRQAGAIIIGKVATHEFATGGPSFDLPWPPRVIRGTGTTTREAPHPAPALAWQQGSSPSRSARTPAVRCVTRPAPAASSG